MNNGVCCLGYSGVSTCNSHLQFPPAGGQDMEHVTGGELGPPDSAAKRARLFVGLTTSVT